MEHISGEVYSRPSSSLVSFQTGYRKISQAEQIWSERLTGTFQPTCKQEVLLAFKRVSAILGFSQSLRAFIDLLCAWTKPVDWQENGWPLVWPSNLKLCEELGFDLRKLQRVRTQAVDAGLIKIHGAFNGRRYGIRQFNDPQGAVVEGCGFDLSPLAERLPEFLALIEKKQIEGMERRRLRYLCSQHRFKGLALADLCMEMQEALVQASVLKMELQQLYNQSRRVFTLLELQAIERKMAQCHEEIRKLSTEMGYKSVKMSPMDDSDVTPNTTTNQLQIKKNVGKPAQNERSRLDEPLPGHERTKNRESVLRGFILTPALILKLAPLFRDWIQTSHPDWKQIYEASEQIRHILGISPSLWLHANQIFGRKDAASVLATIAAKHERGLVRSAGGLLRSFIELHAQNDLHLDKTLYGLLDEISDKKH